MSICILAGNECLLFCRDVGRTPEDSIAGFGLSDIKSNSGENFSFAWNCILPMIPKFTLKPDKRSHDGGCHILVLCHRRSGSEWSRIHYCALAGSAAKLML